MPEIRIDMFADMDPAVFWFCVAPFFLLVALGVVAIAERLWGPR